MIEWNRYNKDSVIQNDKYLVYCVAPQFDSEWIDIARYDDGLWHSFGRPDYSAHIRVRDYAEINYPS